MFALIHERFYPSIKTVAIRTIIQFDRIVEQHVAHLVTSLCFRQQTAIQRWLNAAHL
jgi:hypothetical protein